MPDRHPTIRLFREVDHKMTVEFLGEKVETCTPDTVEFALEAKPNKPRGDISLPTTGALLGFIATLDSPRDRCVHDQHEGARD